MRYNRIIACLLALSVSIPGAAVGTSAVGMGLASADMTDTALTDAEAVSADNAVGEASEVASTDASAENADKPSVGENSSEQGGNQLVEIEYNPYSAEYLGDGMVIAVLDSGFDLTHECFASCENGRLTAESVAVATGLNAVLPEGAEGGFYVSEKIPFAYNYGDMNTVIASSASRGTAVMSVIAGSSDRLKGTAPNAQLLAMKIVSDSHGASTEESLIAAIEDAVTLGADVICLNVSEICGFDDSTVGGISLEGALSKARDAGIIVVSPVGDVREIDSVSLYYTETGISNPTVELVDQGTVAYPASSQNTLAVGNAEQNLFICDSLIFGDRKLPYGDSNALYTQITGGKSFAEFFDGRELEYVRIPRFGRAEDYPEGLDLTGKLALVERGEITFSEKCLNAASRGAIGVIVIDSQVDDNAALSVRMDLSGATIPAVIISITSGRLLTDATEKKLSITVGEKFAALLRPTPTPESTSAVGVTPELGLKPELSVIASSVTAAVPGNSYATYSSTAFASAGISGILACVKQRLLDCEGAGELDPVELSERVMALTASSAQLMYRSDGKLPYSPRIQGSGVASLESALESKLIVTANGTHKLELGELSGRYIPFEVEVENLTDEPLECTIDAIVGSDGYMTFTYAELEDPVDEGKVVRTITEMLGKKSDDTVSFIKSFVPFTSASVLAFDSEVNLNAFAADTTVGEFDSDTKEFTLDAYEKTTLKLAILLDEAICKEYGEIFTNGFFVEGFVRITTADECASVPFVGFKGDFSKQTALDNDIYSGLSPIYDSTGLFYIHSSDFFSGDVTLGSNPLEYRTADTEFDRGLICFSPTASKKSAAVMLRLALSRNIRDVKLSVTDEAGVPVFERELGGFAKLHADYMTNMLVTPIIEIWNGRAADNREYIYPDGLYHMQLTYRLPGDERLFSLEYPLRLDSTAPVIEVERLEGDGKNALLCLDVTDEVALASVSVVDKYRSYANEIEPGKFSIGELEGKYIYVEAVDYALNSSVIRLENPNYVEED